jgi:hypothetical protein
MNKMRYLLFSLFLLVTGAAYPQLNTTILWQDAGNGPSADTIYYNPDSKLVWRDFQAEPDQKSIAAAITASGFGYSMSMKSRNNRSTLVITVYCFFNKKNSWVKQGQRSDYALTHEQHHFDITYIAASRFVSKLRAANFTLSNYESLLEKINDDSYSELERMQNDYDGQTRNGRLKDVQADWNKRIDLQLASMAIN